MTPKPPIWIRARMTTWPKPVQYVGVSTVMRPVTHTDDVAVNKASKASAPPGPRLEIGSISSTVPMTSAVKKPATIAKAGEFGRCRRNCSAVLRWGRQRRVHVAVRERTGAVTRRIRRFQRALKCMDTK
ncbi:hypothetical protein [Arthrobacter rhombi]|uniref:hypothetical protein n=1 Tax=Arthrobacter rhombi TaxID=71253 RepID=UPI003FD5FA00